VLYQPPTFRLVSWPVRLVVLVIAVAGAWMMLEGWANGVRLAKMISAIGERQAAAEVTALRAKQARRAAAEAPGEPGIIYLDPQITLPPVQPHTAAPPPAH
jgi:hypothetical protein